MPRLIAVAVAVAMSLPPGVAEAQSKEAQKLEKKLARDKDASVRADAAWQLGQMGSTESVPALAAALESDSSAAVRANAAASLWNLGDGAREAVPALTKALEDDSGAVVGNAAGALLKLGTPKSKVLPAYRRLLGRPACADRVVALKALATEAPPLELFDHAWECSQIAVRFDTDDSDVKSTAGDALRKIVGRRDKALLPKLLETLKQAGARDAGTLILAVGDYDPPAKEAVPVLVGLLTSRNDKNAEYAASSLGRMKATALPAVPDLVKCLETHANNEVREDAAESLGEIGPKAAAAVPALMKAAQKDKWPAVRKAAMSALGEMGPAAREAVPMLRESLKDPDAWTSMAARDALFRIEPNSREEVSKIADQHRVVETRNLFKDISQLKAALPARFREAYEINIHEKLAFVEAPDTSSPTGRGTFSYEGGAITGPREASGSCKKTIALDKVNFDVVPRLVEQAPGLLGAPQAKVSMVQLGGGVFCKSPYWLVHVEKAGFVEFKLDGKPGKVQKM